MYIEVIVSLCQFARSLYVDISLSVHFLRKECKNFPDHFYYHYILFKDVYPEFSYSLDTISLFYRVYFLFLDFFFFYSKMFDNDLENYFTALTRYHATMNIFFLLLLNWFFCFSSCKCWEGYGRFKYTLLIFCVQVLNLSIKCTYSYRISKSIVFYTRLVLFEFNWMYEYVQLLYNIYFT